MLIYFESQAATLSNNVNFFSLKILHPVLIHYQSNNSENVLRITFTNLDIIDSSDVINGDEAVSGLVKLVESLPNHALPRVRHRGLAIEG